MLPNHHRLEIAADQVAGIGHSQSHPSQKSHVSDLHELLGSSSQGRKNQTVKAVGPLVDKTHFCIAEATLKRGHLSASDDFKVLPLRGPFQTVGSRIPPGYIIGRCQAQALDHGLPRLRFEDEARACPIEVQVFGLRDVVDGKPDLFAHWRVIRRRYHSVTRLTDVLQGSQIDDWVDRVFTRFQQTGRWHPTKHFHFGDLHGNSDSRIAHRWKGQSISAKRGVVRKVQLMGLKSIIEAWDDSTGHLPETLPVVGPTQNKRRGVSIRSVIGGSEDQPHHGHRTAGKLDSETSVELVKIEVFGIGVVVDHALNTFTRWRAGRSGLQHIRGKSHIG